MKKIVQSKNIWVTLIVVILAIGCAYSIWEKNNEKIVLTFGMFAGGQWDVPNDDCYKIIDDAIERFEEKYPFVTVKYVSGIQKDDYSEWISQAAIDGKLPDVFMVLPNDLEVFAKTGILKSLERNIAADANFKKEAYYPGCYEAGQYQNRLFALPYESNPTLLFVNQTLLKKEKINLNGNQLNWNEFYSICRKLTKDTKGDGTVDQFGVYDYGWKQAVYSNGASLFEENRNISCFTDVSVQEAVSYAKKIYQLSGYQSPTAEDFDLGNVGFRPMKFSEFRTYKPYPYKLNKYANFEWDCTQFPAGNRSSYQTYADNLLIGISQKTTHEDYAWLFLKELTYNKETQQNIFRYSQGVSPLREVTNSQNTQKILDSVMGSDTGVKVKLLDTVMQHVVSREKIKNYDAIMDYTDGKISQMIMNRGNVTDTLKEIKKYVDTMLAN